MEGGATAFATAVARLLPVGCLKKDLNLRLQKKKLGRPRDGETRPVVKTVTFKIDGDALEALELLEAELKRQGAVNARSAAIRGALLDAAERIRGHRKK